MFNDWLTIGPVTIHGYGVMIAVGILLGFWLAEKNAKKHGLDPEKIDSLIFVLLISGFVCSKLLYCLTVFDQFLQDPLSVLGSGGWVVYGGILGAVAGMYVYCRKNSLDFMRYFNGLIPFAAMAQGFGRIGCFLAGCCYGIETDAWFGVTFPAGSLGPAGIRVIPTQLIMSLGDFLIAAFLYYNLEKGKHPDDNAGLYLMLYSAGRFAVEFLRGDTIRGSIGPLSTSQFIAVFVFLSGAYLIRLRQKKDDAMAVKQ